VATLHGNQRVRITRTYINEDFAGSAGWLDTFTYSYFQEGVQTAEDETGETVEATEIFRSPDGGATSHREGLSYTYWSDPARRMIAGQQLGDQAATTGGS
jgi:hypothetical protein